MESVARPVAELQLATAHGQPQAAPADEQPVEDDARDQASERGADAVVGAAPEGEMSVATPELAADIEAFSALPVGGETGEAASSNSSCAWAASAAPGIRVRSRISRGSARAAFTSAYRVTSRTGVCSPGRTTSGSSSRARRSE
ncbi:hypothetical protein ABT009_38620 [Streptomyces sp. NPDC002896]|uniref:hypothetical protein n=1 Tax=Streptomyces sp. NPDC002896 TaxID=3154438 RepID=UPI00332EEC79